MSGQAGLGQVKLSWAMSGQAKLFYVRLGLAKCFWEVV